MSDPYAKYMRTEPLSAAETDALRADTIRRDGEPADGFTCDACRLRRRCGLAYDWYNTDGDCLLEK